MRRLAPWNPPVALLLLALAAWVMVASTRAPGRPLPIVLVVVAAAAAFTVARLDPGDRSFAVPAVITFVALGIAASDPAGTFSPIESAGPLGYSNARAQFFVLASFAATAVAMRARGPVVRLPSIAAAAGFALVPPAGRSTSSTGLLVALGILVAVPRSSRQRRAAVSLMLVAVLGTASATVVIAATYPASAPDLGHHRAGLWQDALVLTARAPLTGVGAGRFAQESPAARADAPPRRAHNIYLHLAAETGIIGALVLGGAIVWALAYTASRRELDRIALLGAAAVTSVGVHAALDDVLHQPLIAIIVAALAGSLLPKAR